MSPSPARMALALSITAFSPEPHTLLMVSAPTSTGRPPATAAWRAGACPSPAWITLPMITSLTPAASIPARLTAARIATPPSCGAGTLLSAPWNLPIGVRAAPKITTSFGFRDIKDPLPQPKALPLQYASHVGTGHLGHPARGVFHPAVVLDPSRLAGRRHLAPFVDPGRDHGPVILVQRLVLVLGRIAFPVQHSAQRQARADDRFRRGPAERQPGDGENQARQVEQVDHILRPSRW